MLQTLYKFTGVNDLRRTHHAIEQAGRVLEAIPFLDGHHVQAVTLGNGETTSIDHSLGRQPVGWIVTRMTNHAALLYETSRSETKLRLHNSSADDTIVDLWIF